MNLPATMTQLQVALQAGEISVAEALRAQHEQLIQGNAAYPSIVHQPINPWPSAVASGPLAGIGLSHKDIFDTENRRPGCGHDRGSAVSGVKGASVLRALHRAGAAHFAALSLAEYACGATGENRNFSQPVNPLRSTAAVGGSSSGSATAVASGMTYASLGTDTAGSVRIPAATCALVGLKTTHGLISNDGVFPLAPSLDSVGILARSVDDVARILNVLTDNLAPPTSDHPRLKAWIPETGVHAQVAHVLHDAAHSFEIDSIEPQLPEYSSLACLADIVLHHEAGLQHYNALRDGSVSPQVEAVAMPGMAIPESWHAVAQSRRATAAREFAVAHLRAFDVLMLPALAQPVPDWDQVLTGGAQFDVRQLLALYKYMGFVNYLGFPSLVIPIGFDGRGMPISAQLIARPYQENTLLAFAARFEREQFGCDGFTHHFIQTRTVV